MKVILKSKENIFDITNLTGKKTWSGDTKSAPRTFETTVLKGSNITLNLGDYIKFLDSSNKILFEGFIFVKSKDKNNNMEIKAYDRMFWTANNSDVFTFKHKTIQDIMVEVCKRFGLVIEIADKSTFKVPSLPIEEKTVWDLFKLARNSTFKATGERFILRAKGTNLQLLKRRNQVLEWIIEPEKNLIDFSYSESAENLKTKIKLINKYKKKTLVATTQDDALIKRFGSLQLYKEENEKTNQAELNATAKQMLKENARFERTFSVEAIGQNDVIAGNAVFINIPILGINKAYYVESDSHEYFDGKHIMSLELVEALDLDE